MIITIDGPAGSGKSTAAKLLAQNLGFIHFNSGALFRGVTAFLVDSGFPIDQIKQNSNLPKMKLETKILDQVQHVFVNNKDYTSVLRNNEISTLVPLVALNLTCRTIVDDCQRAFAKDNNIVVEGRDTGSHVFPNAEIKFYLDCSIKERAKRRFLEEKAKNSNITLEKIEQQIAERDHLDKSREIAPLVVPKNAIIIDSSNLSIEQVVETLKKHISTY